MWNPLRKKKQPQPTKEQKAESKRLRALVKDELWKFIVDNFDNVNRAKKALQSASNAIGNDFEKMMLMKKAEFESMKLQNLMVKAFPGGDDKLEQQLIDMMKNESVRMSKSLIDGMVQLIDSFIREEMQSRKPDSLKSTFLE